MTDRETRLMDAVDALRDAEQALDAMERDDLEDETFVHVLQLKLYVADWLERFSEWEEKEGHERLGLQHEGTFAMEKNND